MPKKLNEYQEIAQSMIDNPENQKLLSDRIEYDKMYNNDWDLPASLKSLSWIQKRVIKTPHDSVEAGKRAYATMAPNFNVARPEATELDNQRFDKIENLLQFQFTKASKRRGSIVADLLHNAQLYGEVIVNVVHVDAQMKLMGGMDANRKRGMAKYGDFVINVHNPKDVRVRYSDFGIEGVLLIKVQTIAEFKEFWGDKAAPIVKKHGEEKNQDSKYVCVYDYMDWEDRAVWANLQESNTIPTYGNVAGVKIMIEAHGLPFLPWAARATTNRQGVLYALKQTDAWNKANIAETLMHSESISYAAAPRFAIEGPTGEVEIHYGEPGRQIHVPPGHKLIPLQPPAIDNNLAALADRARNDMSIVPDIVISGNAPAGSAFASINQLMQSGLQTYAPYREVAERVIEDVACLMLNWAKYMKKPLSAPMKQKRGKMAGMFSLETDTYDYDDTEIAVELKPDMPIDRMAQITAASQGVMNLGWTREYANEQLGENDTDGLNKQLAQQALTDAKLQGRVAEIIAEDQKIAAAKQAGLDALLALAQDPMGAQLLQQVQQQLMAAQQGGPPQQAQGMGSPPNPANTQGLDMVEGEGFNPNAGGTPPAMASPGAGSQPMATGADQLGNQVV